eukprot:SAG11_NODE_1370_length_5096_cov_2.366620_8_plen_151_part_00
MHSALESIEVPVNVSRKNVKSSPTQVPTPGTYKAMELQLADAVLFCWVFWLSAHDISPRWNLSTTAQACLPHHLRSSLVPETKADWCISGHHWYVPRCRERPVQRDCSLEPRPRPTKAQHAPGALCATACPRLCLHLDPGAFNYVCEDCK